MLFRRASELRSFNHDGVLTFQTFDGCLLSTEDSVGSVPTQTARDVWSRSVMRACGVVIVMEPRLGGGGGGGAWEQLDAPLESKSFFLPFGEHFRRSGCPFFFF
jgi:hypothetical protein